jgi:hypothetical protein
MPKATIEYPDDIVSRNNNGGWHHKGKRAYRNAVRTIMNCLQTYREARLYHLCFEGQTHKVQMKMLNGMVQIADRAGIKLEWFACREVADRTKKAHVHAYVIIDAYGGNPYRVFNQFDDGQVAELCTRHGVNFSIFSPKDDLGIHGNTDYMTLPYQGKGNKQTARGGERLKDALRWLAYAFKARSKPTEEEADGQLFPASRPNRQRKTLDASPLADLSAPVQDTGDELNPAEKFIAAKYEAAVDLGLDVEAIRQFLLAHGIKRTPAQVKHELDNVYGFYQYADRHPAPTIVSAEAWDKAAGRKVEISFVATTKWSYNGRNRSTTTESRP